PAENSPQTTIENQEAQTPKQTPAEPEKISYDKRLSRIKIDYTTADGETLEGINPMPLMRDLDDRLNGLQRLVNCIG
ncbi:MAG: hypothetical protein HQL47_03665, partial [Gammaproteobacteria bacterium]|nr:hypothetical protein [Gammaproteobacteria bacterium]